MLAECKGMKDRGADLIELRLDALQTVPDVKLLLKDRPCPMLITCRREEDGGRSKRSEADRLILLRTEIKHADGTVDVSSETFECSECGKKVPANAKKCPYCGADFDEEDE